MLSGEQTYTDPMREQIEAVEQVRSLEEMAPLEQVEQIGEIASPRRLEEPIVSAQQIEMIRPVEEFNNFIDNEVVAPSRKGIPECRGLAFW